ncbi:hypothetical protein [Paenibacillus lutimineralis]|uniref:Uncharacterized protein n=1 Tax=Paenibacillus lutimineralis TaxID=2707005 RepID=A0A3Q9IA45_9BACL|nr:hypothetical protein [Paenibacillus lutimineralis]AZS14566.1 hypothetical protein EI981_08955 [Paenibacillus lutimineralis]
MGIEKMTYAEYLQENLGVLPIRECLDVLDKAEQGKLTDFDVEQELTPVVGTILSNLFNHDMETFDNVLGKIKNAAKAIREREEDIKFRLDPCNDSVELVLEFDTILNHIRDGYGLKDHWLDEDGEWIVILGKSE